MNNNLGKNIENKLKKLADEKYKKFHSSLCPNNSKDIFLGVRIPVLKKYAKELLKEYRVEDILKNIKNDYYEEIMLEGIVIANSKISIDEKIELASEFVPKIINWAICDVFCADFKFKNEEKNKVWDFIIKYQKSDKEFEIRFLVVMMLSHFLEENYIDKVFKIIEKIKKEDYYVKMSVAWLISVAYVKYKDKTENYLYNCSSLDDWTYNKAIQKIIESYRVSKEDKENLKRLKRK